MNTISFMSANFVARQLGYHMTEGWAQGNDATEAHFRPLETFPARFTEILNDVKKMGFEAIDIWGAHLHPRWATEAHIAAARAALKQVGLRAVSLAGWWDTLADFESSCKIAAALDVPVLGGGGSLIEKDRPGMVRLLRAYKVRYGLENHPEKTPEEVLAKLGPADADVLGAAVDTGWFGTHGYDAALALEKLAGRVAHVHLKDVLKAGEHRTCQLGSGVVPIERCVAALKAQSYQGAISIEHEPHSYDPTEELIASAALLRAWLA